MNLYCNALAQTLYAVNECLMSIIKIGIVRRYNQSRRKGPSTGGELGAGEKGPPNIENLC